MLPGRDVDLSRVSVAEVLRDSAAQHGWRKAYENPYFEHLTIHDLIRDPEAVLEDILMQPGVGRTSLARIKVALFWYLDPILKGEPEKAEQGRGEQGRSEQGRSEQVRAEQGRAGPRGSVSKDMIASLLRMIQPHPDRFSFNAEFSLAAQASRLMLFEEAYLESEGAHFFFFARTIPEMMKSDALLGLELGQTEDAAAHMKRMRSLAAALWAGRATGTIFMDRAELLRILRREGQYAALTDADIAEQVGLLRRAAFAFSSHISAKVVDYASLGLAQGFIVRGHKAILSSFGGYIICEEARMRRAAEALAERAEEAGEDFAGFLDAQTG